ncbi:beta-propeller fold lactonase family protein [Streptomyces xanthophaeus]
MLYAAGGPTTRWRPHTGCADGLTPLGRPVSVDGLGPAHLSVAGDRLLIANYTSGSVSVLGIARDGRGGRPGRCPGPPRPRA